MPGVASRLGGLFNWTRKDKGPVRVDLARTESEGESREATIAQLRRGYTELVDTMKAVRGHLDEQSQQSRRMLEVMQVMPDLLRAIPEQTRNQTRLLEAIHANIDHQNRASGELSAALSGLTQATQKIGTHIQDGEAVREEMTAKIGALDTTIGRLSESNREAREALRAAFADSDEKNKTVRDMVARSHRQVVVLSIVSWALAIIALAASAFLAVMVVRLVNDANASTPAVNSPALTAPADPT